MARKHRRNDETAPLTITPADIPKPRIPKTPEQRRQEYEAREAERQAKREERRRWERTEAVDWKVCLVPYCELPTYVHPADQDTRRRVPLCPAHEAVVWRRVQFWEGRTDDYVKATEQLRQEQRERDEEAKRRRLARQDGSIYYVRLNGLIKVGWSRDVYDRLRAYGPDVEILCVHDGTRQDETTLHRNLRPFLARGREWYEDCPAMHDIVARAVERHGKPSITINWTRPAEPPIKRRRR